MKKLTYHIMLLAGLALMSTACGETENFDLELDTTVELNVKYKTATVSLKKESVLVTKGIQPGAAGLSFYGIDGYGQTLYGPEYYNSTSGFYFDKDGYACAPNDEDVRLFIDFDESTLALAVGMVPDVCTGDEVIPVRIGLATDQADCRIRLSVKIYDPDQSSQITIDENASPKDVALSYTLECDAATSGYELERINLKNNAELAQAFVMLPDDMESIVVASSSNPTANKIVFGLTQPDGSITYDWTANAGFYIQADGYLGSWSNGDPIWVELSGLTLVCGHYPGKSVAGTKYVIKPTLVYTKGGKQYQAVVTVTMQF